MSLPGFSWTQLGAFVATLANVSDTALDHFASCGGRWITPVLYNDESTGGANLTLIPSFKIRCFLRGIRVGCWANAFGEDPQALVAGVDQIVRQHSLSPVVFDAEIAYQGNTKMSYLTEAMRKMWPLGTKALGISTNSMNDSQVYNGRKGGYPVPADAKSFRDFNIHVLPQWYSAPRYWGAWTHADQNMEWVHTDGMKDNWEDLKYTDHRAVRKTQIHGTLEVTGLELADLATSLNECAIARNKYGLGRGISLYLLENTPISDFALVAKQRGYLYTAP